MTDREAIEHAKALQMFCAETDCSECPFMSPSKIAEGRDLCRLVDYEDPPHRWELEDEKG